MNNYSKVDLDLLKSIYKEKYDEALKKLESGYPIQYLIGYVEFIDTKIEVNENVLIPRFETEYLVSKIVDIAKNRFKDKINIIDLGCGSGCIAIDLKKHLDANLFALDISNDAIEVAKRNAINNQVEIEFINQDMTKELNNKYDIIVSNPPYIKKDGYVEEMVKKYEPNIALFADDNGLFFYKEIISKHMKNLNKNGFMAFEIGDNEKDELETYLKEKNIKNYEFSKDLAGMYRYLFIFNE